MPHLQSRGPTTTVDPFWIRNPSDHLAIAEGCFFDPRRGVHVIDFIESFCCHSIGRWRGKRFRLLPWQRDFVMRLFGWRRSDGTRRFRRFYLEVPKKNGKSTLISALVLYFLLADGERAPEVFVNAVDRSQANIIWKEAARMVRDSPELACRLQLLPSKKLIVDPVGDGSIQANSADIDNKDGLNASHWLFDELHRQKSRAMWDVFEYAGESREQPLAGSITTAGEDSSGIWFEQRDYSERVNAGIEPDSAHLGIVYRADPLTDDLDDPAVWRRVNPSMGYTISEEEFKRKYAEAKRVPSKLAYFHRVRLNIVTAGEDRFTTSAAWSACGQPAEVRPGEECFLGLDMSARIDLTALVALFPRPDGSHDVLCRAWTPSERLDERSRNDGAGYRVWADAGSLEVCDGGEIDYDAIKAAILDFCRVYKVRCLGADPMFARQMLQEMQEHHGVSCKEVRQGPWSLCPPTKDLERLIATRKIRHGGSPVLAWCVCNAIARRDSNGNPRLDKAKSKQRIDAASALVNALAVANEPAADTSSVYLTRGIRSLG